ncbi:hypothetical protein SCA6_007367 [Theobroma cacao]
MIRSNSPHVDVDPYLTPTSRQLQINPLTLPPQSPSHPVYHPYQPPHTGTPVPPPHQHRPSLPHHAPERGPPADATIPSGSSKQPNQPTPFPSFPSFDPQLSTRKSTPIERLRSCKRRSFLLTGTTGDNPDPNTRASPEAQSKQNPTRKTNFQGKPKAWKAQNPQL